MSDLRYLGWACLVGVAVGGWLLSAPAHPDIEWISDKEGISIRGASNCQNYKAIVLDCGSHDCEGVEDAPCNSPVRLEQDSDGGVCKKNVFSGNGTCSICGGICGNVTSSGGNSCSCVNP